MCHVLNEYQQFETNITIIMFSNTVRATTFAAIATYHASSILLTNNAFFFVYEIMGFQNSGTKPVSE